VQTQPSANKTLKEWRSKTPYARENDLVWFGQQKADDGKPKVRVQRQKVVRSWFFAQDGGFYVQCKYGSKAIALSKDGNAIFVKQLSEVKPVLETLRSATENGELDAYVAMAINVRKNRDKLPS
jgi:hypothetical protein